MTKLAIASERMIPEQGAASAQPSEVDHEALEARQRAAAEQQAQAVKMMMVALQALGQRFVVALSNLFTLLTVASAFYLWIVALPDLNTVKIIGLAMYAAFVLLINVFGRRT